ncbi:MAG: twin-arginine translocation signal domain-containing protein, partial [Planctomycetes bacterium]|nr:twin-arginine translocation signal domain-containing protein [Planctomycetota bacterium]
MCEQCTRREFLGAGAAAGGLMLAGAAWTHAWTSDSPPKPAGKSRICVIFSGPPGPEDRGWNADPKQMAAMRARLAEAEKKLGNIELVIGESNNVQQTAALLEKAGPNAPVLAINLNCFSLTRLVQPVLDGKRPMIVFSLPASGHDWMYPHRWQRRGSPVTLVPSSDYNELERALRLLRVIPMMRQTRILLFPPARGTAPAQSPDEVKKRLGADVVAVDEKTFGDLIAAADDAEVRAETKRWTEEAKAIIEPNEEDIVKAARVSVALQNLMKQEQAQGLAIGTCMGWLPKGFPCLGFARLRDAGIPAACEGDMDSLLTMLLFQYALDRATFQGNATFDTSRNALWTAHCTAPLNMDGPNGKQAPYLLRGHSEVGGSGCVPEVHYRVGETVTRTKLVNLNTILASTGKIIEVPEKSVRACRTQIVTEVRDAAKMAANWSSALETEDAMTLLHRVVFYGDHM